MSINMRLLALYTLPVLVAGTEVIADDAKTFPGSMCQPISNANPVVMNQNGGMRNPDNSRAPQVWFCPIVRDTMAANSGEFAGITVAGDVTCIFRTNNDRGTSLIQRSADNTNPPVIEGTRRFTYASGSGNFVGASSGIYFFACIVPSGASVVSYSIEEDE